MSSSLTRMTAFWPPDDPLVLSRMALEGRASRFHCCLANGRLRRVGDVCRASGEGRLIEPKPAGRPRHQGLLLVPLAEAERTEQHRAVALALGEPIQAGPSVEEARRALSESQHQHRLARSAIATLEAGARDLAPQLTFAVRM